MSESPPLERFALGLERLGLGPFLAGLLEAGGEPLGFLAAQSLFIAQPALGAFMDEDRLAGLARWLEDPESLAALARRVRQDAAAKE
jgi:hypothetical protein